MCNGSTSFESYYLGIRYKNSKLIYKYDLNKEFQRSEMKKGDNVGEDELTSLLDDFIEDQYEDMSITAKIGSNHAAEERLRELGYM